MNTKNRRCEITLYKGRYHCTVIQPTWGLMNMCIDMYSADTEAEAIGRAIVTYGISIRDIQLEV